MIVCSFLSLNSGHSWAYSNQKSDDYVYLRFAKHMARSVKIFHPEMRIVFLGVNVGFTQALELSDAVVVRHFKDFSDMSQAEFKGWLVREKIKFIFSLLKSLAHDELLVYMDADCLLRRPLFIDEDFDIGFRKQQNKPRRRTTNVGVLFLRNNKKAHDFVKVWLKLLPRDLGQILPQGKNGRTISNEQFAFYKAYLLCKNKLKVWEMPSQYNDGELSPDSYIWHGNKGDKRDKLTKFEKELSCQ